MKIKTAILSASLVLAGCTTADQKADDAYWAKDYQTAYAEFLPLAQGGDWLADERIAFMYAHGQGRPQDLTQAQHWYEKAAQDGDIMVATSLARDALHPPQGAPDYATAAKWYQLAADRNNPYAQLQLSIFYEHGLGVARDHDTALHWLNQFVGRTDIVGQKVAFKYSGGDNTGGYMAAVQQVFSSAAAGAAAMQGHGFRTVVLSYHQQDGRAQDVKVDQTSGDPAADAAAVALLQQTDLPPVLASLTRVERFQLAFTFQPPGMFILNGTPGASH